MAMPSRGIRSTYRASRSHERGGCFSVRDRFNPDRSLYGRDRLLLHAHKGYLPNFKIITTVIVIFA